MFNQQKRGCFGSCLTIIVLLGIVAVVVALNNNSEQTSSSTTRSINLPTPTPDPTATLDPVAARLKHIESGFSAWDGSHIVLTKIIKEAMHNPKSYEHVDTVYSDRGDYLIVITTYRGTNAFGGIVTNKVTARADLDGNILEIINE